ncbi:MAG: hypothetical protein HFI03_04965 [Lachnospiraceae bacterium]|nr:hypothetical protein [Lachnospiraceae bacterium]
MIRVPKDLPGDNAWQIVQKSMERYCRAALLTPGCNRERKENAGWTING